MSKQRRRWYTVFLGSDEVFRCLALSEKEAIDNFESTLPGTLDEFCAEHEMHYDDMKAREDKQ